MQTIQINNYDAKLTDRKHSVWVKNTIVDDYIDVGEIVSVVGIDIDIDLQGLSYAYARVKRHLPSDTQGLPAGEEWFLGPIKPSPAVAVQQPIYWLIAAGYLRFNSSQLDGCVCISCGSWSHQASSNQIDGSFICYSCRKP